MACQLLFLNGSRAGTAVRFEQPSFWLGRDPRCEMSFDPATDLTVSGRHLQISQVGQTYQLTDSSTNGTRINGAPVKQVTLNHGDVLELGQGGPQLRFLVVETKAAQPAAPQPAAAQPAAPQPAAPQPATPQPAAPPTAAPPLAAAPAPVVMQAPIAPTEPVKAKTPPAAAMTMTTKVTVVLDRVDKPDQRWEFTQQVIRIGRDPSAEVAFDPQVELLVSYNHAKIMVMEGKAVLFDSESTNGTFVEGRAGQPPGSVRAARRSSWARAAPGCASGSSPNRWPPSAVQRGRHSAKATIFGGAPAVQDLSLGDAALLGEYPLDRAAGHRPRAPTTPSRSTRCTSPATTPRIEQRGGGYHLMDAGSANGTYLDGERITEAPLAAGTEFLVGPYMLKFTGVRGAQVFDTRTKTWVDAYELCRTDPQDQAQLPRPRLAQDPARRVRLHPRPLGLRQVDAAQEPQRAQPAPTRARC